VKFTQFAVGVSALGLLVTPAVANAQAAAAEKPGSAYVQCDGQPNNMSDGETAARLLGAVTLLGLFAPPPESADASKRKFGEAGVAACSSLLSGDKQEGNVRRRIGLILGRAIHNIEAKKYDAALADVAMARNEAQAGGLLSDPYFVRSRGRAFEMIESAALIRQDRAEEARTAGLRNASAHEYSMFTLFGLPTYNDLIAAPSDEEDRVNQWRARLAPPLADIRADRLEMAGRFAEAARVREALLEFDAEHTPETNSSTAIARAAVAHALAGNMEQAAKRAADAKANSDKRKADGKPETDSAELVELLDLYTILNTAHAGDLKSARRLFSARSEWVGASLGSVLEATRRLRTGAAPDEMIGGLSRDSGDIWKAKVEEKRAALLAKDSDNKTLFYMIPSTAAARDYEAQSKAVWRTDKSKLILKTKPGETKSKMELMYLPFTAPTVAMDAYVLHAALVAQSRGHEGFVFQPIIADRIVAGSFRTGNRGQAGFSPDLFIDAKDAIAKLSPIIPSPETLKARQSARR
jgi:hypothetical protein